MPRLGITGSVGTVPTLHVRRGAGRAAIHPLSPITLCRVPQEEGEPGREGSHGACLRYLRCVLLGKGASLAALPAHRAGKSALLPLLLSPAHLPISHQGTTGMGKQAEGEGWALPSLQSESLH